MIFDNNTQIRQIKFIQGNVTSSEYTINEYVHNVPRQNLKKKQFKDIYIMHIDKILNQCTTIIKILWYST